MVRTEYKILELTEKDLIRFIEWLNENSIDGWELSLAILNHGDYTMPHIGEYVFKRTLISP